MAKRTIQTCRFYADIPQYLKALGFYEGSNTPDVWDMNPINIQEYNSSLEFNINRTSFELDQLLTNIPESTSSGVYGAVFGHTLKDKEYFLKINDSNVEETTEIINYSSKTSQYNGYSFWNIDVLQKSDVNKISLDLNSEAQIGAVSFGRWFEPEKTPDLKIKLQTEYDGIMSQETVGGNSITNINHLGQPHWGDLPAWTLEKKDGHDYKLGANTQRRTWNLSFSYMSSNNIFNKSNNPNKFFTVTDDNYEFDTSMASFFLLTLNGKLRFWFCPNSDGSNNTSENLSQMQEGEKDLEFALCQIDQDSLVFNQVAFATWNVSMKIREVY